MDSWEEFDETSLPDKNDFCSCLNMENVTDIDSRHAKRVEFKVNNLGGCHDIYVQSDTLLLADVLQNFRNMCIKTYELDPFYFLSLPRFARQACLKMTGVELELLTEPNMLLMVEEGVRVGVCQVSDGYA